jgi:quinol monooxygenase YgiN
LVLSVAPALSVAVPACADSHVDATRDDDVQYVLYLRVKDGHGLDLPALMEEMNSANAEETGTRNYEWFQDGDSMVMIERYDDSEAVMEHLGNWQSKFSERWLQVFDIEALTVFGPADENVRAAFEPFAPTYLPRISGFSR